MLAGVLMHPAAAGLLLAVGVTAVLRGARASGMPVTKSALARSLVAVVAVAALVALFSSYVSPEQARELGVTKDQYWSVLFHETFAQFIVLGYFSILGASLFSIPVVVVLAKSRQATAPRFLVVSVLISTVLISAVVISLHGPNDLPSAPAIVGSFVAVHTILALGFAIGAKLPWRLGHEA